ncbi:MAG: VanZ family protein [Parcubacteria group bacterium GW2011_GWC2_42_6]|nr:MAG: VanZ family protein [Parcubacteria group bacterium GW2011_GWA2_42_11]KKS66473.1 MAG: VanZ family protein [Parcubacteria group bacterium GW2011_GWC2_42_6]
MEKLSFNKFLIYWLPVIVWAGGIFYLSSIPGLASGMPVFWDVFWRKLAHATEFGILSLLLFRAWRGSGASFIKALIWSLALAIAYALADEAHQHFVPLREGRLKDVGVDSLGIIFSSAVILFFYQFKKK